MPKTITCFKCGKIYHLTPIYADEYIARYEDMGCPYCKERKVKEKEQLIHNINNKIVKCKICGKGELKISDSAYTKPTYSIGCDCLRTNKSVKSLDNINDLICLWNERIKNMH